MGLFRRNEGHLPVPKLRDGFELPKRVLLPKGCVRIGHAPARVCGTGCIPSNRGRRPRVAFGAARRFCVVEPDPLIHRRSHQLVRFVNLTGGEQSDPPVTAERPRRAKRDRVARRYFSYYIRLFL